MTATASSCAIALQTAPANDADAAWVHLVPTGTFRGRDGRGPWFLDDPNAFIAASQARAGQRLMPVDFEHSTIVAAARGLPAPAAGWISGLQARKDGIWGLVKWTAKAASLIAAKEYRYISPVFLHEPSGRVLSIFNAGLTNNPNLDQLVALSRMETPLDDMTAFMAELRTALGLPDTADPAAILLALRAALQTASANSADPDLARPDPAKFVPIGDFQRAVSEVNRLKRGVSMQAASDHVGRQIANGNMPPFLKDWGVQLCSVNKTAFDAFVAQSKDVFNRIVDGQFKGGRRPEGRSGTLDDTEMAVCARMGLTQDELIEARAFSMHGTDGR